MQPWSEIKCHQENRPGDYMASIMSRYVAVNKDPPPLLNGSLDDLPVVKAEVNHGRWIATCGAGCGHALLLSVDAEVYLCSDCGMGWQQVEWPKDRTKIEAVLLKRPHDVRAEPEPASRNWIPGETIKMLREQNAEKGIS